MSFISSIKKAFGFGADDEVFEDTPDEVSVSSGGSADSTDDVPAVAAAAAEVSCEAPARPEVDPAMKARIFSSAVAVFNEALPDFLRQSVDPEAQSRRLAQALDEGVSSYLDSLMSEAQKYAEARLKSAADQSRSESERLRREMERLEQQRTSLSQQKLSADRRYRAIADRVADLEKQLEAAEADREQLDLEKRSLLNKLKVADMQPGMAEEMAAEIERLKARLEAENEGRTAAGMSDETAEELRAEVEKARTEAESARAEAEKVNAEAERVRAEAENARTEAEKARNDADSAWEQANEARAAAEKAMAEAGDLRTQQEAVQGMYTDLQNRVGEEREAREKAEKELAEARAVVDSVNELQEQMSQVEEIIRKRDQRIARLKAANRQLHEQIEALRKDGAGDLPHDDGLFGLPSDPVAKDEKFSVEAMNALEEDFECPDWFVSEPAPGETSPLLTSDAEFGYQEPPRKPRKPENDAQLSLF